MTEVTWTACHAANLVPGRGRGLKLLGLKATVTDAYTLTTGLDEISGVACTAVDADADADSMAVTLVISAGQITFHTGKYSDHSASAANEFRILLMGTVR